MRKAISLALLLAAVACNPVPRNIALPGITCDLASPQVKNTTYAGRSVREVQYTCPQGGESKALFSDGKDELVAVRSNDIEVFAAYLDYSRECFILSELPTGYKHTIDSNDTSAYYCSLRKSFLVLASSESKLAVEEFWR